MVGGLFNRQIPATEACPKPLSKRAETKPPCARCKQNMSEQGDVGGDEHAPMQRGARNHLARPQCRVVFQRLAVENELNGFGSGAVGHSALHGRHRHGRVCGNVAHIPSNGAHVDNAVPRLAVIWKQLRQQQRKKRELDCTCDTHCIAVHKTQLHEQLRLIQGVDNDIIAVDEHVWARHAAQRA